MTAKRYSKGIYHKDAILEGIRAFGEYGGASLTENPEAYLLSFALKDGSASEEEMIGEFDNYVLSSSIALEFKE